MGSIHTLMKGHERIWVKPFPTRALKVKKVVRVDYTVVALTEDGDLYSNSRVSKPFSYCQGSWSWQWDLYHCLVRLGVISKEAVESYSKQIEEGMARDKKKRAKKKLLDAAETLGIKLTKAQQAKLETGKQ